MVSGLALGQTEGLLRSLFGLVEVELPVSSRNRGRARTQLGLFCVKGEEGNF